MRFKAGKEDLEKNIKDKVSHFVQGSIKKNVLGPIFFNRANSFLKKHITNMHIK
jgi:hypothetical protein